MCMALVTIYGFYVKHFGSRYVLIGRRSRGEVAVLEVPHMASISYQVCGRLV
jgi:hypothetical protein